MQGYQHGYHAGNGIDVLKHSLLAVLVQALTQKERPLTVFEGHAGRGLYPVEVTAMELHHGLGQWPWQTGEDVYSHSIRQWNYGQTLRLIPGSPAILHSLLRPQDIWHLYEYHPQEYAALQTNLHRPLRRPNTHAHQQACLPAMAKLLRQGHATLVHLDPAYEGTEDYTKLPLHIAKLLAAQPQATVMLWLPCTGKNHHQTLLTALQTIAAGKPQWLAEGTWPAVVRKDGTAGVYGTMQWIVNPPYTATETLTTAAQHVAKTLGWAGVNVTQTEGN